MLPRECCRCRHRSDVVKAVASPGEPDANNVTHGRFVCAGLGRRERYCHRLVVRPSPARHPTTTLLLPAVRVSPARRPTATFSSPLVRAVSAMLPRAVLAPSVAVVPLKLVSAASPTATLSSLVVFSPVQRRLVASGNQWRYCPKRSCCSLGLQRQFR